MHVRPILWGDGAPGRAEGEVSAAFTAERNGLRLGTVCLRIDADRVEIVALHLASDATGRVVADILLDQVETFARQQRRDRICIATAHAQPPDPFLRAGYVADPSGQWRRDLRNRASLDAGSRTG